MVGLDVYQNDAGQWDWRFFAENGEQQCESHQGYESQSSAQAGFVASYRNMTEFVLSSLVQQAESMAVIEHG